MRGILEEQRSSTQPEPPAHDNKPSKGRSQETKEIESQRPIHEKGKMLARYRLRTELCSLINLTQEAGTVQWEVDRDI